MTRQSESTGRSGVQFCKEGRGSLLSNATYYNLYKFFIYYLLAGEGASRKAAFPVEKLTPEKLPDVETLFLDLLQQGGAIQMEEAGRLFFVPVRHL